MKIISAIFLYVTNITPMLQYNGLFTKSQHWRKVPGMAMTICWPLEPIVGADGNRCWQLLPWKEEANAELLGF